MYHYTTNECFFISICLCDAKMPGDGVKDHVTHRNMIVVYTMSCLKAIHCKGMKTTSRSFDTRNKFQWCRRPESHIIVTRFIHTCMQLSNGDPISDWQSLPTI